MSNFEKLIADLNKKCANTVVFGGADLTEVPKIPMNNIQLDYLFRGGFPEGKLYEFYGPPSSGKTVMSYKLLSEWQKLPQNKDRRAIIFDYEDSHTDRWATTLGVNMDKEKGNVIIWRPMSGESAEDMFDLMCKFADTGEIGFIILDSVGALVSKARKDKKSFEEKTMGGIAGSLTDFINEFNWRINRYNITFVAINQLREEFDNPNSKGKSPGGKAFKHNCGIRLFFSAGEYFDYKGDGCSRYSDAAGHHITLAVEKNKLTINDRKKASITFRYLSGIDDFQDNIEFAVLHGFIRGSGAWYEIIDYSTGEVLPKKINGMKNVIEFFKNNMDMYDAMYKKMREYVLTEEV